jgi:arylsulfatase A-like enzyme
VFSLVALVGVGCGQLPHDSRQPIVFVAHTDRARSFFDDGQFRSFRKNPALTGPITFDGDTRQALIPPLPAEITFEVDVPKDPILRFATGASTLGAPVLGASVEFRVSVIQDGRREIVFTDTIKRAAPNQWFDHEADLTPWAETTVRVSFETRGPSTRSVLPAWGNPVLSSRTATTSRKLILISIDCLRSSHLSAYGYQRPTSPRIDELAADGVVFESASSTSSYTHPTHMSMLTGLPPSIHGATRTSHLPRDVPYLAELLADSGFRTDGVVSGAFLSQSFGFERGFHTYRYVQDPGASHLVDEALRRIDNGQGQPQFLFLHLFDAHWPYSPPPDFRARFGPRPDDISTLLERVRDKQPPQSAETIRDVVNLYDGEIAYLDQELGRFFDGLRTRKLYDDALIIVTADHGEAFYEHGHWEHTQTLYEEMVRVPLIVKWPRGGPRGRIATHVSQADVFPTIVHEAGLSTSSGGDGAGQTAWSFGLREPKTERTTIIEVTWEPLPSRGAVMKVALRRQDSKYIATLSADTLDELADGAIRSEELYDLDTDPEERHNLIEQVDDPARRAYRRELRSYLAERRRLRRERRGEDVVLDNAVFEQLDALGYIER